MTKSFKTVYDLIIVGAGASGLFAGAEADQSIKTLILERNTSPGIKLLVTGSGQCNLTHDGNIKDFVKRYNNPSFVRTILYAFTNDNLIQWFEEKGLKCIKREDGKIFPASLNAQDVLSVLLDEINKKGHQIKTNEKVQSIKRDLETGIFTVNTDKCRYSCRNLILAGGGKSYPMTGSNGELFEVIKPLGIRVTALKPSLTTVKVLNRDHNKASCIENQQERSKTDNKLGRSSVYAIRLVRTCHH